MGYSLSWAAVRGKTRAIILAELGLRATGEHEELPESPVVGSELPLGRYLVVADRDDRFVLDSVLRPLSAGCDVVACHVEEHVMYSTARGWRNGREAWSVTHDVQKGVRHLEATGDLPLAFPAIRQRLESEQQGEHASRERVDYVFDIPVETAKAVTGFRHDEDIPGAGPEPFEILAALQDPAAGMTRVTRILGKMARWLSG